jgi:tRNA dimethylallyltransferase
MNKILVILGPTSSGKSDIAIKLAKKFNGEIISADSRQIFRGMDIGTGKIERDLINLSLRAKRSNPVQLANTGSPRSLHSLAMTNAYISHDIPHYMIDIVTPRTDFNVAKFKKQAEKIISDILNRDKLPIICGGTGFWIQAIVDDVNFPEVKPDWKLREKLEKHSAEKLFAMLKKLDPTRANNIDTKNKVRLIRAVEICKKIGKVPSIKNIKYKIQNTKYKALQIGLKLPKEKLHQNIEKRVIDRFKQGMIEEVEYLHTKKKLSWKKIQSFGLAYFWIPLYLQKKISKEELVEKVIQDEKKYAKRQITWFKRDKRIKWLESYGKIERSAKSFLK